MSLKLIQVFFIFFAIIVEFQSYSKELQTAGNIVLTKEGALSPGDNVYSSLMESGIPSHEALTISKLVSQHTDIRSIHAGTKFKLSFKPIKALPSADFSSTEENRFILGDRYDPSLPIRGDVYAYHLSLSDQETLTISHSGATWSAKRIRKQITWRERAFAGIVSMSLWQSAERSGMDPILISQLAEVFAWQVDFAREVRSGDKWRLVAKQRFIDGKPNGWGDIEAAEYHNRSEKFEAFRYKNEHGRYQYFTSDGDSLKKMFLKSPIKFARISSRFSMRRFHPILKRFQPHNGVDYAASTGTPIRSVGRGRVVFVGWKGPSGRMVKIRHNSTYQTAYLHLSRYPKGLKQGSWVEQGDIIGFVGSSGRATAPHLHFSFYENGRYVDPLGRKFPSAAPLAKSLRPSLRVYADKVRARLPQFPDRATFAIKR